MNISQFAAKTALTPHTLRYYEKLGLLMHVQRNRSGHRSYSQADMNWVMFINRLRETGMPLKQILEYAQLRAQGDQTFSQRQQLLQQHRDALKTRIESEQEHLRALDAKIQYYASNQPLT
ncbi:MerR family transcriptional regulator [Celerinatantimonas sp. YJH-8]|uniref:MerR family transcriptional regulator n=1 Tax=Celerinatantimonas sp. YJH-8 TaxID=3228714 RepID=UPI0038C1639C